MTVEAAECGWCDAEFPTIPEAIAHMRRRHPRQVYVYLIGALELRHVPEAIVLDPEPVSTPKPRRRRVKP